uniref:Uncharacterized protein n=1 Tax=Coccidioides posadasii RMSCC 3488 TaxID=454284 RepID=A0A0J6F3X7_COCPO|nr:hypothetical protein CPAG_00347 [Coccidioides posadasii RMSCC 3488]
MGCLVKVVALRWFAPQTRTTFVLMRYQNPHYNVSIIKKIMLLKHRDKVHMLDKALISHKKLAKEVIQDNQDNQDTSEIVQKQIASLLNPLLNPDEKQKIYQYY